MLREQDPGLDDGELVARVGAALDCGESIWRRHVPERRQFLGRQVLDGSGRHFLASHLLYWRVLAGAWPGRRLLDGRLLDCHWRGRLG
jgi:hypothetical protein